MHPTGLFPRTAPRPTDSHAEHRLFEELRKKLPARWTAWHSLRLRVDGSVEGEGDFVIAIPDRGVLVLEVKGGAIRVRDGQWLQNGTPLIRPPRDQGMRYARLLRTKLEESSRNVPFVSVAVAFPDTSFRAPPSHGDLEGIVLGAQDVDHLEHALPALVERLFVRRDGDAMVPITARGTEWIERLHALWGESWTPTLALGDEKRRRCAEMVALDEEQLAILDGADHNDRFLILGGAGTGKTLLARELAARLATRGLRVLFLCSSRALATGLRADGIASVWPIREYAAHLLGEAQICLQGGVPNSAWTTETWEDASLHAAVECAPNITAPWDAVIVDEAQDFSSNDWELVRALAGSRVLWGFGDDGQAYWPERTLPRELFGQSFHLRRPYRCPPSLARFADLYRDKRPHAASEPPEGAFPELRVIRAPSAGNVEAKIAREIDKATVAGLEPRDIAILSLAGVATTTLGALDRLGSRTVVRADDTRLHEHVVADTFLRFKGLERPLIVIGELGIQRRHYDVRMHIALSRATVRCIVIGTGEELDADPRLSALISSATSNGE